MNKTIIFQIISVLIQLLFIFFILKEESNIQWYLLMVISSGFYLFNGSKYSLEAIPEQFSTVFKQLIVLEKALLIGAILLIVGKYLRG